METIFEKPLDKAVADNTDHIEKFGYYMLSSDISLTSSYETNNTYNSRKFSDYNLLVILYYRGNWLTGSDVMPTSVFSSLTGVTKYISYDNVGIEYDIKYASDTSFECKKITTDTANIKIRLYGLRIEK